MGRLFKTDGDVTDAVPANGADFTLGELQQLVGGEIEVIDLCAGQLMVINMDRNNQGIPVNECATYLYKVGTGCQDLIRGNVVLCDGSELQ